MMNRWFSVIFVAAALLACSTSPMTVAETNAQRAYAALGEYEILLRVVADTVCGPPTLESTCPGNPDVSAEAKLELRDLKDATTPTVTSLYTLAMEYEAARAALAQGATTKDKVDIANANLLRWTLELQKHIDQIRATLDRR